MFAGTILEPSRQRRDDGAGSVRETHERESLAVNATLCGVARKYPRVQRSSMSATMMVNIERSGSHRAVRHAPARSRSSKPGADW